MYEIDSDKSYCKQSGRVCYSRYEQLDSLKGKAPGTALAERFAAASKDKLVGVPESMRLRLDPNMKEELQHVIGPFLHHNFPRATGSPADQQAAEEIRRLVRIWYVCFNLHAKGGGWTSLHLYGSSIWFVQRGRVKVTDNLPGPTEKTHAVGLVNASAEKSIKNAYTKAAKTPSAFSAAFEMLRLPRGADKNRPVLSVTDGGKTKTPPYIHEAASRKVHSFSSSISGGMLMTIAVLNQLYQSPRWATLTAGITPDPANKHLINLMRKFLNALSACVVLAMGGHSFLEMFLVQRMSEHGGKLKPKTEWTNPAGSGKVAKMDANFAKLLADVSVGFAGSGLSAGDGGDVSVDGIVGDLAAQKIPQSVVESSWAFVRAAKSQEAGLAEL